MKTRDPVEKEMATHKKDVKMTQAELDKQAAREHNAAVKQSTTEGQMGHTTGAHPMSALPGHGTGHPMGHTTEGVVGSHPIGTNRGPDGTATAHNTRVGGNPNATGYTTGGSYT